MNTVSPGTRATAPRSWQAELVGTHQPRVEWGFEMIILGLILLIIGLLVGMGLLTTIGGILILVGAILWILGATGRAVGGRKHFF
ncbi:hypothetical protein [Streptomyces sp. JW3]|uniref:hypothetical protein n=1 Tax=Streptomyces sp. JW3 TaxID=3456955 RepID=UPI003FA486AE